MDGPLNLSRSVQGRPVLHTTGGSATFVDVAFLVGSSLADTLATANALKKKLVEKDRLPGDYVIAISQTPLVGRTDAEADEKYRELVALAPHYRISRPLFMGSTERVANELLQWYEAGALNMFIGQARPPAWPARLY